MNKQKVMNKDYGLFAQGAVELSRPVLGKDLDVVRNNLGMTIRDATWLFGMNTKSWYDCTRKQDSQDYRVKYSGNAKYGPDLPVDESLALLVRIIDVMPKSVEHINLRGKPMMDLRARMTGVSDREFGELLGRDASASYRWFKQGAEANPTVLRLCDILVKWIDQGGNSQSYFGKMRKIEIWRNVVSAEYAARREKSYMKNASRRDVSGECRTNVCVA